MEDQHSVTSAPLIPGVNNRFGEATLLAALSTPASWGGGAVQRFLSNGAKNGLNGNILGQQLSVIWLMAVQQTGPIWPIWPIWPSNRGPIISVRQLGTLVRDDQHFSISCIGCSCDSPEGNSIVANTTISTIRRVFDDFAIGSARSLEVFALVLLIQVSCDLKGYLWFCGRIR